MAKNTSRTPGRFLSRLTVATLAAALIGTTAGVAQAGDAPKPTGSIAGAQDGVQGKAAAPQKTRAAAAPLAAAAVLQPLMGVAGDNLYFYDPNWKGGYGSAQFATDTWGDLKAATQADQNGDGIAEAAWAIAKDGHLYFLQEEPSRHVGGGWNTYNRVFSPGDLAGAQGYDLLARDGAGVLWLYLGYANGDVTKRYRIGSGWGQYTQIAGTGDISGDGKSDIVARDGSGTLWLYQGTGSTAAPFKARVKVGAGWNTYNTLVGAGDLDGDGIADLVARGNDGTLWRYSGAGDAKAPYKARVKIGTGGWNKYRFLF
ncbi:VCBS repeat-containing protein [Streptomyces sp. NBC_00237]|uniref:FG-GAP repeat domain-containing protein n=1 Tax=Streptomyces sp. NBC_00237 TaxID=2975687 RepID=UPI002257ECC6|nr:VCBS repeat-containing protein [Streptomyces sp. NBC_00237]MCX5203544.1 VCBS repeat-containing protein [Streptomyces sp. NBC_00237]